MNDVMEVIRENYSQSQLIPVMLALKRYCPDMIPPVNLSYMSSSYTYLNYVRAFMRADCPLRSDNMLMVEIRKELEAYMPKGELPTAVRLTFAIPERLEGHLPAFEALFDNAFEENRLIRLKSYEEIGRSMKIEINLRKDPHSVNHFYGPEKLASLFSEIGIDFAGIRHDVSTQINLCFQSTPAEDLWLVPLVIAIFLKHRHESLPAMCKHLKSCIDSTASRPYIAPVEKVDKPRGARKQGNRA